MPSSKDDKPRKRAPGVRPISRITSGGLSKLKSARCFPEIDRRMRLGWSTSDLVSMIRDEYNECLDIKESYLRKVVDLYRKSIPPAELTMSPVSVISRNATKKVSEGLDELSELEKLYNLQLDRISIDVDNEKKIKKLFPTTGREVFVAMKLLRQSAELKMDLGLVKRQLGTMEVTGQLAADVSDRYGKDHLGKVIADPDSRRKVLGLAERLLAVGAKASIDAIAILGEAADKNREQEEAETSVIDVTANESNPADSGEPAGLLAAENPDD